MRPSATKASSYLCMRPYATSCLTLSIVAEKEREMSNLSLRLKASDLSMTQGRNDEKQIIAHKKYEKAKFKNNFKAI
jgi:hypothetical protein